MDTSVSETTVARFALGFAVCGLFSWSEATAQSPFRALVVVADPSDAECTKRIGGEHVHVELLFPLDIARLPDSYEKQAQRVHQLLDFHLLVFRGDSNCPTKEFWRNRMTAANPQAKLHQLSQPRGGELTHYERKVQRATDIHRALDSILPKRRVSLNANLDAELRRLNSLHHRPLHLAERN